MSFAENLKRIRKERGISQEELAEMLDVSRQAVSKWELAEGYPEVEKLLLLSDILATSLDSLMGEGEPEEKSADEIKVNVMGNIVISSPHENVVVSCSKVMSSQMMKGGKKSPKYALFASSSDANSFWGAQNTFLGWYSDYDALSNEVKAIHEAIISGKTSYELRYSVKVEKTWFGVKVKDNR